MQRGCGGYFEEISGFTIVTICTTIYGTLKHLVRGLTATSKDGVLGYAAMENEYIESMFDTKHSL